MSASCSASSTASSNSAAIIVLGMAGSGKSTFVQRVSSVLHQKNTPPYLVNLDPAVTTVPYPVNIDIRDTVKYKQVMNEYQLGPNGAIMTSLNLMCTKFDQVVDIIKARLEQCSYCLLDTPGQIEAFVWSASGTIMTDLLASSFPTMIVFVVDSVRATNPTTFMSNMVYACSILYRTKLPFIIVLNKTDIVNPTFAKKWMSDFESFQEALDQNSSSFRDDLTRSLSLVLDRFYQEIPTVSVSSLTGEGIDDFLKATKDCIKQYHEVYRPVYEKLLKDKAENVARKTAESFQKLTTTERVVEIAPVVEPSPENEKIHIGGKDQENLEDAMLLR
ncbi:unnamed protein product [Thelazia callipaeda]|uniref:GPN-loop GTPase n=1 Tax=Thelazia callipaeda TaxID=103827 RepID=A0A0N5CJL3_THECL|nr:unnamed protein product [Thelazia callipaeda]